LIQPYKVGSKKGKSLAVILPADITKHCHIDPSTFFVLRVDGKTKRITLQGFEVDENYENVMMASADQRFEASAQQMLSTRESKK